MSLPRDLIERAERLIHEYPQLGLRTKSELVTNAVRDFLSQLEERAYTMMALQGKAPPSTGPWGAMRRPPGGKK